MPRPRSESPELPHGLATAAGERPPDPTIAQGRLQAALPGLGYGPGFVVRQTSFAISNAVPAGGAVGLGIQYGMLDSYGFGAGAAAGAIAIVSVFNVFATLVMPVLGVVALLASGMVEGTYLLMAAIGILAVVVAVVAFMRVLGSERGARTVGRGADRLADPLTRRLGRGRSVDVTGTLLDFRPAWPVSCRRAGSRSACRPCCSSSPPGRSWSWPSAAAASSP